MQSSLASSSQLFYTVLLIWLIWVRWENRAEHSQKTKSTERKPRQRRAQRCRECRVCRAKYGVHEDAQQRVEAWYTQKSRRDDPSCPQHKGIVGRMPSVVITEAPMLKTIPGIGLQTIAKLIVEYRDLEAFRAPVQLIAFAGLNPQQHHRERPW